MRDRSVPGVNYDHVRNIHTTEGPRAALPLLLGERRPQSLLDVGCGAGTWLRAALDLGIEDVLGLDGVALPPAACHVDQQLIQICDLAGDWGLGRTFDIVLCLEVAEHLEESVARPLVEHLAAHGRTILFSAANRWQRGQHHVNCQWPLYWQALFNDRGFVCRDVLRWKIWDDQRIEPWYRQNIFEANHDPKAAGNEPRLASVIHPDYLPAILENQRRAQQSWLAAQVEGWTSRWRANPRRVSGR